MLDDAPAGLSGDPYALTDEQYLLWLFETEVAYLFPGLWEVKAELLQRYQLIDSSAME